MLSVIGDTLDWSSFSKALNALVLENKVEDNMHKDNQVESLHLISFLLL